MWVAQRKKGWIFKEIKIKTLSLSLYFQSVHTHTYLKPDHGPNVVFWCVLTAVKQEVMIAHVLAMVVVSTAHVGLSFIRQSPPVRQVFAVHITHLLIATNVLLSASSAKAIIFTLFVCSFFGFFFFFFNNLMASQSWQRR
jgi:hypothetical protein